MLALTSICLALSLMLTAVAYLDRKATQERFEAHFATLDGWSREVARVTREGYTSRHHVLNQLSFGVNAALTVAIMAQVVLGGGVS